MLLNSYYYDMKMEKTGFPPHYENDITGLKCFADISEVLGITDVMYGDGPERVVECIADLRDYIRREWERGRLAGSAQADHASEPRELFGKVLGCYLVQRRNADTRGDASSRLTGMIGNLIRKKNASEMSFYGSLWDFVSSYTESVPEEMLRPVCEYEVMNYYKYYRIYLDMKKQNPGTPGSYHRMCMDAVLGMEEDDHEKMIESFISPLKEDRNTRRNLRTTLGVRRRSFRKPSMNPGAFHAFG